ncbi:MAG: YbaK/EbsC family protein [Acidimicrobiia bacterium]|nr:MAG: YbaK/EbsC family protein [Acidimicrobiia bacterium]
MEIPALEGVPYRLVEYEPAPDIAGAADRRGTTVDRILKTMVVRVEQGRYALVLVPGDRVIDWKALRTHLGVRRISLADAEEAYTATGYRRGTITPFGASGGWPVIVDASVPGIGEVSVGSGRPGVAIHLDADDLIRASGAETVAVSKAATG